MKKWLVKFLTRKLYAGLQEAAEFSERWQASATEQHAQQLARQLLQQ